MNVNYYQEVAPYRHIPYNWDMDKKDVLFPMDKESYEMFLPMYNEANEEHLLLASSEADERRRKQQPPSLLA